MMKVFLTTRVNEDKPTRYIYYWCDELLALARKAWDVQDLANNRATRKEVEGRLKKQKPELVIFNGHGNEQAVFGSNMQRLVVFEENDHLFEGKTVFIRACSSGAQLGPNLFKKGAKGFIGYKRPFTFIHDPESFSKPLDDLYAEPFRVCSNQVAITLLKGHSVLDAHTRSMDAYAKELSKLISSDSTRSFLAPFLLFNMRNQVYCA